MEDEEENGDHAMAMALAQEESPSTSENAAHLHHQLVLQQQKLAEQEAQLHAAQDRLAAMELQQQPAPNKERRGSLHALETLQQLAASNIATSAKPAQPVDVSSVVQASMMFTASMVGETVFVMVRDWLDNTTTREKPQSSEEAILEEALTAEAIARLEQEHARGTKSPSRPPQLTEKQKMLRAQSVRKLTKARSLREIVTGLRDVGRLDEAEQLAKKILAARRQMYGEAHVATANACNQLGVVLTHKGRFSDALLQFQKGVEVSRAALGPDSMCEASLLLNQAHVALLQAEEKNGTLKQMLWEEAARYGKLAGDIYEKRLGAKNERTIRVRSTWALGFAA
jgi:tetratricopeptide (TPR) repeat protein